MKLLAQLPTPTIATRTLPSSERRPLGRRRWVAVGLTHAKEVLPGGGWMANYPELTFGYTSSASAALERLELPAHVPDALADRERGQPGHHVDRRGEQVDVGDQVAAAEHEADGK